MYDGRNSLEQLFATLLSRKYKGYYIFAHNLSRFDSIFLLTVITDLSDKVFPVIRNGKYIDLRLEFGGYYNLYFRDSLLLLPASLDKLSKQFNIENPKGIEPVYQGDPSSLYYMENLSHYNKKVEIITN